MESERGVKLPSQGRVDFRDAENKMHFPSDNILIGKISCDN